MADNNIFKPTSEQVAKAKAAASPAELLKLAQAANIEMSQEAAQQLFDRLHPAEEKLSIDDLDDVAGGCSDDEVPQEGDILPNVMCPRCNTYGPTFSRIDSEGRAYCQCTFCGNFWSFYY